MAAQRYMIEMDASEYRYISTKNFKVSSADDPDAIEFVRFYLKGQSFLYNQIRKMVGCMIQVFHGQLNEQFVENTLKDNVLMVCLAPGDGLLCEKVAYDKYNELTTTKEPIMVKLKIQK
jgi:tRNA pseudouridine38-40 synthase